MMLGEGDYLAAITEAIASGAHRKEDIFKSIERTHRAKLRVDGKRHVAQALDAMVQRGILQLNSLLSEYTFDPSFHQAVTNDEAIVMRMELIRNNLIAQVADKVEAQEKSAKWMREQMARLEEAQARLESENSQLNDTINQFREAEETTLVSQKDQLAEQLRQKEVRAVKLKEEYRCLKQSLDQCDARRMALLKRVEESKALLESKRVALENQRVAHKHHLDILEMEKEQADIILTRQVTSKIANVTAEGARLEALIDLKRQQIEIRNQITQLESQTNLIAKVVGQ